MKKIYITLVGVMAAGSLFAQNEYDALRYSQTFQQGTARSAAMGGAFGALGGDLSVLTSNPAGLGVYRKSEFTFTPQFGNVTTSNSLNGLSIEEDKFSFRLANLGFAFGNNNQSNSGFSGVNFAVAYNRLYDLCQNNRVYGYNNANSLLDAWTAQADGNKENELNSYGNYLGYDTYLINTIDGSSTKYNNVYADGNYNYLQEKTFKGKGGINSWDFAIATSYRDILFMGASLGVQSVNYKYNSTYTETDLNNNVEIENFNYNENLKVHGTGVNLKVGVIVKPIKYLRFGAAIHTPTVYDINEKYYSSAKSVWDEPDTEGYDTYESLSPHSDYSYHVYTPFKAIFSAALVDKRIGLLSIDYEYVDYSKARFEADDDEFDSYSFVVENDNIKNKFQKTNNLRIGGELLFGQISARAGYAMYGNPYKYLSDDIQRQIISGGIGIRGNDVYFDLTCAYHMYKTTDYLYWAGDVQQAYKVDNSAVYAIFTVGFKF